MPELVYNVKFQIDTNIQEGAAGVTAYKEKVEDLAAELAKANAQIDRMRKGGGKNGADPFKNINQGAVNAGKSFSIANQAVFSLSDGIQDATQFSQGFSQGMRAIGNNIGFTTELMANLGRRVDEYNKENGTAITRTDAFREAIFKLDKDGNVLRNSFGLMKLSATGFVLALNLGLTALTYLTTAISNYNKKSKEATESTSDFTNAVKQFYDLSRDSSVTQLSNLEKEVEFYQRRINILQEEQDLRKDQRSINKALSSSQGTYNGLLSDELNEIQRKIASNKELQNQFGIQQSDYDELNNNLQKANANYNAFTKGTSESEVQLGLLLAKIKDTNTLLVNEYNLALDGSNEKIQKQIDYLIAVRNQYILAAKYGRTELIPVINGISKEIDNLIERTPALTQDVFQFDVAAFSASFNAGMGIFAADAELFNMQVAEQINGTMSLYQINEDLLRNNLEASAGIAQEFSDQLDDQTENSVEKRAQLEWSLAQRRRSFIEQLAIFEATRNIQTIEDLQVAKDTELEILRKQRDDKLILEEEYQARKAQIEDRYNKSSDQLAQTQLEMRLDIAQRLVTGFSDAYQALFGENKAVAIAETIISTFLAAQRSAAAAASLGPLASKLAAAAEIAQGIARIAKIKQTNINSGSISDGGGTTSTQRFGFQMNKIEGAQTFRTPAFGDSPSGPANFNPKSGGRAADAPISVQIMADRKQLYALVKRGEEEYRQVKI